MEESDKEINKQHWEARVLVHMASDMYNMNEFLKGRTSLNSTEIHELGDVTGKKLCHLQCHFGQDSISWARAGASVTGIDFSSEAIKAAQQINNQLKLKVKFIESDVLKAAEAVDEKFDIVFTSYGTIGWLPNLDDWATQVCKLLKPGGVFYMIDFHPVVWMFNDELTEIGYSYFNVEKIIEETCGTYADRNADIKTQSIGWNHSLSEISCALIDAKLRIEFLHEFGFSWYNIFPQLKAREEGGYMHEVYGEKMPMMYSFKCIKD
ncbi:MAG: class I SAM-dependent methyltransferase [Bacteroidia bacterium]